MRPFSPRVPRALCMAACCLLVACTTEAAKNSEAADTQSAVTDTAAIGNAPLPSVSLVDSTIPPAIAGQNGWNYRQDAMADLTGDGTPERVVLTAQVEMLRGRPVWDDGQAWQVYIEHADSTRSYVYANRLQLGTLAMRVARPDANGRATVILIEHLPDRLRVAEVEHAGALQFAARLRFERLLDPVGDVASPMR